MADSNRKLSCTSSSPNELVQGTEIPITLSRKKVNDQRVPRKKQKLYQVDNPDVAKFLNSDAKVRKLKPLPDSTKYDVDPFANNPLLQFRLSAGRAKRVYQFLEEQAVRNKIHTFKTRSTRPKTECLPRNQLECHQLLRKYGEEQPTVPLQDSCIKSIQDKLHGLHLKFPLIAAALLDEIRANHLDEMHRFGISLVVKPLPGEEIQLKREKRVGGGKTALYNLYLRRKAMVKSNLHIFHPIQRRIFTAAITTLPKNLTDFDKYRALGYLKLEILKDMILTDIKKAEHSVTTSYYAEVVQYLDKRHLRSVPAKVRPRFLASATNILRIQVTDLMYRSIKHLLWLTEQEQRMPYLELNLVCDDGIALTPSQEEIYGAFHNIIESLADVAQKLTPLETWVDDVPVPKGNIAINLNQLFLDEAHKTLQVNLEKLLLGVNTYIGELQNEHNFLYTRQIFKNLEDFKKTDPSFDAFVEKRLEFEEYKTKLGIIISNEYFGVFRVSQNDMIENLKKLSEDFCDALHNQLFYIHCKENLEISGTFQQLKEKALKDPESTEELLDMGVFMLGASSSIVEGLEDRISQQLSKAGLLIELTDVPAEHVQLMSKTVNWISAIKPVFELNSSQYEQHKFEFEERLQKRQETLTTDIEELGPRLVILNNMDDTNRIPEYIQEIRKFLGILDKLDGDVLWINHEESLFKFPLSSYQELDELHGFLNPFAELLFMTDRWQWKLKVWMHGSFQDLDAVSVEKTTEDFLKEFLETQKTFKSKIKQQIQDNVARRFKGNVDDPDPNNIPVPIKICAKTLEQIKNFKNHVPLVKILCNNALMQRHWDEMSAICGFDITPDFGSTLSKVVKMDIQPFLDQFEVISIGACKEQQLGEKLRAMWSEWTDVEFILSTWKETDLLILSDLDDIQALLDDHLVKTLTMRGSAFVKPFESQVKDWYNTLDRVNKTIEEWGRVQVQWLYLLPIFSSKNISSQMKEESALFRDVDSSFCKIMQATRKSPRVLETAGAHGLYERFTHLMMVLEKINHGVNEYLEKKRLYFPRFFFLSNDEMLEILSETQDPLKVEPYLRKCFEGINNLNFNENLEIEAMISSEGEIVKFSEKVSTKAAGGSVEKWLKLVENQMVESVRETMKKAVIAYRNESSRTLWIQIWPAQIVLAVSSVFYTADVHSVLRSGHSYAVEEFYENLKTQLEETVNLIRGNLPKLTRLTLGSLIVIDVHAKDIVENLWKRNMKSDTEFGWLAQLRYYWEDENCFVRMINTTIKYAYEYLGNTPRLVITPLTDRCYRTLIGAYSLHLNGAPEGPAGTGKTETTKDLAKALAVQCIVFNCSDGLDYKAMGKFFKGLASSGAWACFDEFNRIELEVLSVVAQQILSIMRAVQAGTEKFLFEGTELVLNPACYICITMNPGYAGRSELPDNLKVLFRTVAMMVPDYALIAEISLYSFGFLNARPLSVKIVTTYRLCSEQLSAQSHYDYGMRAVKTVLTAAGQLKIQYPSVDEQVLMHRALVDVNKSKLIDQDVDLFDGIVSDMFPQVEPMLRDYSQLDAAVSQMCQEHNLQLVEYFKNKVVEFYEMLNVRHGVMLVGEPFGGKSSVLKVLAGALETIGQSVSCKLVNPKSLTMDQLYGQFDPISADWSDGVLALLFRFFVRELGPKWKWLVLDGPVDAIWVENLNTVLDDNKKLCLSSGEVMAMPEEMRLIFEVGDLLQASPATVSRCGMIYFQARALGFVVLIDSWIQMNTWMNEHKEIFREFLLWIIPACLRFLRKHCWTVIERVDSHLVSSMLSLIRIVLTEAMKNPTPHYLGPWLQAGIVYAGLWGLAGTLDQNNRIIFNEFYLELLRGNNEKHPIPECIGKIEISLPIEGCLFDFVYSFKAKGNWRQIADILKQEKIEEPLNLSQMLVPTIDTVKYSNLIDIHVNHDSPLLLIGPTGTGKTFLMQNYLMTKMIDPLLPAFVSFTPSTTANDTQKLVISKLFKRKKNVYGPPTGQKCVLFIDDLNMSGMENFGAQPAVELLRQFFDAGFWYDLKDKTNLYLTDILILTAMGLPGGGRHQLPKRFLRHLNVFLVNDASDESMNRIFTTLLFTAFKRNGFASDSITAVTAIVNATLDIYQNCFNYLRPTPKKSHYLFNLRDFARVIKGCGLIKKESVDSRKIYAKLWVHEALRVFYDRLNETSDQIWLIDKLKKCVKEHLKENFEQVFDSLKLEDGVCTENSLRDLMFGCFLDLDAQDGERKYEEITMDQLLEVANSVMDEYNSTHNTKIDLVLFRYALEHIARISRILLLGNGLLIGVSGVGRQSLTRLVSAILNYNFFQPEITAAYSVSEWRNDLKKILKDAGGRNRSTVFLVTDSQIRDQVFLSDIDSLLNLGEVPELFSIDEQQDILELVRLAAQGGNRNLDVSPVSVFNFFVNRCKQKLHVVLCFSPIGAEFRDRLRNYSSLVNCCTIDWFFDWPVDALELVAVKFLSGVNLEDPVKGKIITAGKYFHESAKKLSEDYQQRVTYITNAAFIELMTNFSRLISKTQEETQAAKAKYMVGLEKLDFAANQVTTISKELSELKPKLVDAKQQMVEMMEQIESEKKKVEAIAFLVKQDEKIANEQAASSMALKAECEADLAQAIPILEEAIAALNTLKPADITLVKSMKNPPDAVKLVMAAVCVMKDVKPDRQNDPTSGKKVLDYWGPSKRILGDMAFLQQLKDYDKDNIQPDVISKIRKEYIPHKDFKPNVVAKASSAAEGLCKWVIAMDLYDAVAKEVAPKKAKLEVAEKALAATMVLLNEKRTQAMKLEEQFMELLGKLQETQEKKQLLEDEVTACANKLARAEKLIDGLGGEKTRWENSAQQLQNNYKAIAGDIFISCGIIAYLGPFRHEFRMDLVTAWHGICENLEIPASEIYSLRRILGSEVKIQNWEIFGLPSDAFSIDNAIILDISTKWPLLIDPQNQAGKWIRKMEKENSLEVIKLTDSGYMKIIIDCITYGKAILIENIQETLDPALDPILNKNIFKQFDKHFISLRDDVIEYNPNFKLYLICNLRNAHHPPEICNKVRVIDFSLTLEGLEDQLLNLTVAKERPDLQKKRQLLIVKSAENKKSLLEIEAMILQTLSGTKGNILEDETAIETLDAAKLLSARIKLEQESTEKTENVIESFRLSYRPIAAHSAVLYYCIADLARVDPMYQYSLVWFVNLFKNSVDSASRSKVLSKRLSFLKETFTYSLYSNVTRSLFEKDKLLFSFILCVYVLIAEARLSRDEFLFLINGGSFVQGPNLPNPTDFLNNKSWQQICALTSLKYFREFDFTDLKYWKDFCNLPKPTLENLADNLTNFQKLIVLSILRPEAVLPNVSQFIESEMGGKFTKPPTFDLTASFSDSNCFVPLIFVLSPGSDPMNVLTNFALKLGIDLESVSLGQGQGPLAAKLIAEAQSKGSWICLQNCHLAASWMPSLEKIWESMDNNNTKLDFRLWLTSYPSKDFPTGLLQNSVKITKESPKGLQQNILKSFSSHPVNDSAFFNGCPGKNSVFGKILYGITFFHAVVKEREKFGPIGWNIPYGFDESDYQISVQQVLTFISEYSATPYEAIVYLTGECNYGGRVTDEWDRRMLLTILNEFVNENVVNSPTYKFADDDNFGLPRQTGYQDYLTHIELLPRDPSPLVVGLNANAGITQGLRSTKELLNSALALQGTHFFTSQSEKFLQELCKQILDNLPENFDIEAAFEKFPVSYQESMNALLLQELQQFNKLLDVIRKSLKDLSKAVLGLISMTPELDELAENLQLSKIPKHWSKFSYPSLKPLASYLTDLHNRIDFFRDWFDNGKPSQFWISGFYSIHGLLTGVLQNFARKFSIPIDQLTFDFQVMKIPPKFVSDGALIYGLFLEGARWGNSQLLESLPAQLYDQLPVLWIRPVCKNDLNLSDRYVCPLYKTLERRGTLSTTGISTNFVFTVLLNTKLPGSHWVKRGVALICQLDD